MRPLLTLAALALLAGAVPVADPVKNPNVVDIVADDLGFADIGFQGCKDIPTPHLDALTKSGVVCTNGYATHPFCSPTFHTARGDGVPPFPPRPDTVLPGVAV